MSPGDITVVVPGTEDAPLAAADKKSGVVRLLCVATLIPRKGHDLLIEALASMRDIPWRLTCVGSVTRSVDTVETLRRQLRALALEDRVELAGELRSSALTEAYVSSDLFILPTRYEGYCMAVAEAIAHGLPVVSTRTGAIPELVGARGGLLVPPDDGPRVSRGFGAGAEDEASFALLREGARDMRAKLPRWHQSCMKMAQVLEQVGAS